MLHEVEVGSQSLASYASLVDQALIDEILELAKGLKGCRLLHLSATSYGGGVAELLRSEVPLQRDLGLHADWKVIHADEKFFSVTKAFHNALQGAEYTLTEEAKETYLTYNTRNAQQLEEAYDCIIVHDPQPAAIPALRGKDGSKWVWRCHIDTSYPNPQVWAFLKPFIAFYDGVIFTMGQFVPSDIGVREVALIAPAIDPLAPKNMDIPLEMCRRIINSIGVDVDRPLITQVSRFDPWKDPCGVVDAYRIAKKEFPDLQLAMVGSMALDDPESWRIYSMIREYVQDDKDAHVFTNFIGVGNVEVNAFQRLSQVGVQKSIREGFGLVVSETLWKGTPMVAGRAGGIPIQLEDGVSGYLIDNVEQCADRIIDLLKDRDLARKMGERGREKVRREFLMPRLVRDKLAFLRSLH
ncbi:MAG: glycosyltransferase [Chloroflexi bacterium]|nr:glycosyltransferase [Chloroflexota bacterium]